MPAFHRVVTVLATASLVLTGTAGCGAVQDKLRDQPEKAASVATEAASTSVHDVKVSGGTGKGEEPAVDFPTPLSVTQTQRAVITSGDGPEVKRGQRLTVDYVGINATDGNVFDSSYARGKRASFLLTDSGSLIKGLVAGLQGVPVGSRVVISVPPEDGYGIQGVPASNIGPTDTLVFVVDVHDAGEVLKRAKGTKVAPKKGLPTVSLDDSGEPEVTLPSDDPPATLVVQTLVRGTGSRIETGDSVTVHYKAVIWPGGTVYHSTWDKKEPETFEVGTGRVLTGLDSGLIDQRVGSQVLLVIPPDQGYGAAGKPDAGIKGTDTLVFVVDILEAA